MFSEVSEIPGWSNDLVAFVLWLEATQHEGRVCQSKISHHRDQPRSNAQKETSSHVPFGMYVPSALINAHEPLHLRGSNASQSTKLKMMPIDSGASEGRLRSQWQKHWNWGGNEMKTVDG